MKNLKLFLFLFFYPFLFLAQPNIALETFGPTFSSPVSIKHANDDRLFVVEQSGLIKILNSDGTINSQPFLDIQSTVLSGGERGLLGLAFHPDYANNGYFYVNYTNASGNTVVSRFSRNSMDSNLADSSSEVILLTVSQPYSNHNGGDLAFGPYGYLHIALGDGGSANDPGNRAQDLNSMLGKILRIDVNSGSPYGIPSDNPFLNDGDPNTLPEIWAYGLRNPWRFSVDSTNEDIWIADVGQGEREEINRVPISVGGINYGWRCYEGDIQNTDVSQVGCPDPNILVFPISTYSSAPPSSRCSITGGYKYNGSLYPNFQGLYFFADYCSNEIGYLEFDSGNWEMTFTSPFSGNFWSAFGEDYNGELYIAGISSGQIYKITDTNLSTEDFSKESLKIYPNPAKNQVTFNLSSSTTATFDVYNISGDLIDSLQNNTASFQYNVEHLKRGMYFIKTSTESGTFTKKLVIN